MEQTCSAAGFGRVQSDVDVLPESCLLFPGVFQSGSYRAAGDSCRLNPVLRAGYQVRIIDSTITPNFHKRHARRARRCTVSGDIARHRTHDSRNRADRASREETVSGQTGGSGRLASVSAPGPDPLPAEYVDAIVIGQGEDAFLEIVERIEAGESLKGIAGVGYKEDGKLVFNSPRALRPISEMPPKAYHLADFDAYQRVCGRPLGNVYVEPRLSL